jgi:hypothetical protein
VRERTADRLGTGRRAAPAGRRGRLTAATSALYGPATLVGIIAPGVAALLFKVLSVPSVLVSTR